jgi:hypothetical protein
VRKSAKVEKPATFSRDTSKQQDLTTETSVTAWWTASEKIGTSLLTTAEGTPSTAGMPAAVETPTTILISWDSKSNRDANNT